MEKEKDKQLFYQCLLWDVYRRILIVISGMALY